MIFLSRRRWRSRIYWNLCFLSSLHCWFRFHCSIDLCVFEKECFIRLKTRLTKSNEHFQDRFYQFFNFYFHRLWKWRCHTRDEHESWRLKKDLDDSAQWKKTFNASWKWNLIKSEEEIRRHQEKMSRDS